MVTLVPSVDPMRRLARRFSAGVLAVALFMATGGATLTGVHCAHHDGAAAQEQVPAEHAGAPVGHADDHASHGTAHAPVADDAPASHGHDDAGACTCLGVCQGATTVPAATEPSVVFQASLPTEVAAPELRLGLLPRVWQSAWFLPPGNGPPVLT